MVLHILVHRKLCINVPFIFPYLSIDRVNGSSMVPCMFSINLARLLQSSTSGSLTLVNKNETAVCMSERARSDRYSICAKNDVEGLRWFRAVWSHI